MAKQSVVSTSNDPVVNRIDLSAVRRRLTALPQAILPAENWPAAELEYRRYLTLRRLYPGRLLIPTGNTLNVWQAHILDTRAYRNDCETTFGRFIDHFPYLGQKDPMEELERLQATRDFIALYRQHYELDRPEVRPTAEPARKGVELVLDLARIASSPAGE